MSKNLGCGYVVAKGVRVQGESKIVFNLKIDLDDLSALAEEFGSKDTKGKNFIQLSFFSDEMPVHDSVVKLNINKNYYDYLKKKKGEKSSDDMDI